ncbi:uncharacterized protein LOC130734714 isoform X2 [Lotus japonicus]|nr:uncharacterized protein LOC130734714 isoform X2 [Lotus japonicus]
MEMPEKLRTNCILLSNLESRWEENRFGFKIQDNVVPFTPLDVCFSLGLRLVGLNVNYNGDEDAECHTKGLFKGEEITVKTIVKQLRRHKSDDKVDDFCRLYILLVFATFYFPQSSTSCLLRMLDNLNSLQEYSWGVAVYDTLVLSLSRCAKCLNKSKNKSVVRITGCAAILQIWALEHMFLRGRPICTGTIRSFPRFLRWQNVAMRKDKILKAFEDNRVLEKLAATSEELQYDVVMEAMQKAPSGFPHRHKLNFYAERERHVNIRS